MRHGVLAPIGVLLLIGMTLVALNLDLGAGSVRAIVAGLVGVGVGILALVELLRERFRKPRQPDQ